MKQFGWERLKQCFDVYLIVHPGSESKFNKEDFCRLSGAILQNLLLNNTQECLKNPQIIDLIDKAIKRFREIVGFEFPADSMQMSSVAKESESELYSSSVDPDNYVSKEVEQFTQLVTFKKESSQPVRVQRIFLSDIMTVFHIMKCLSIIAGSREWTHKELIVGEHLNEAGFSVGSPLDCIEKILFAPVCIVSNSSDPLSQTHSVEIDQVKMSVHGIRKEAILILKSLILMHKDCMIIQSQKDKSSSDQKKKDEDDKKTKSKDDEKENKGADSDKDEKEVKVYSWQKA